MIIAGKCPPNEEEFEYLSDKGFAHVELYLTREHLDEFEATVTTCKNAPVEVVSVHTPHVTLEETEYLRRSNDLADRLDATLVFHSGPIHTPHLDVVTDELTFTVPHAFESQPGQSIHSVEQTIFGRELEFVFDIAHVFLGTGEQTFYDVAEELIQERGDEIRVVHLCDSSHTKDGLAFGEGILDMTYLSRLLKEHFDGIVVLEVMPEDQRPALEQFRSA